jgi:hypothetical protein
VSTLNLNRRKKECCARVVLPYVAVTSGRLELPILHGGSRLAQLLNSRSWMDWH